MILHRAQQWMPALSTLRKDDLHSHQQRSAQKTAECSRKTKKIEIHAEKHKKIKKMAVSMVFS
jgi:hypothetical protein